MKKIIAIFMFSMLFSIGAKAENSGKFVLETMTYEDVVGDSALINGINSVSADIIPVMTPRRDLKEWTVMFYSNAKDQLRYAQVWQILDMKKIGSTDKINVVIEAGMPIKYDDGTVSTTTLRMAMGPGANPQYIDQHISALFKNGNNAPINYSVFKPLEDDIVSQTKNEDMGNWKNIANFTRWAKANYPAKRYVFIIYGHGTGFFDQKKQQQPDKGISLDMQTGNYVTLPEMTLLMRETGKVDVFAMYSCLMQMAEVAHQVKDYADVVVGSSELMWSSGYDLMGMLNILNANTSVSSEDIGSNLVKSYVERVKAFNIKGGHASAIITSKLPGFVDKLNDWVDATMSAGDRASIVKGINDVIRFDIFGITTSTSPAIARRLSISGDLYDFVDIISKNLPQNTPEQKFARKKGLELMKFISNDIVYNYAYTGQSNTEYDFSRAHGLSIHIPPIKMPFGSMEGLEKNLETLYWDLPFARDTKWGDFLKWIYEGK